MVEGSFFEILGVSFFDNLYDAILVALKELTVSFLVHDVWQGNGAKAQSLEICSEDF